MTMLAIAPDLKLPLDAVTQTFAILARKRSGKSYTARRLAEQMFGAGLQIVAVDPKGDWWGMRSSADGKGAGLPIVILGGERGDVPLEVGGGELVAKLVVEEQASVLLDLSLFRKHEVATFVTAFAENLYRLKAREQYRTPLMLFIDEADAVAPQKPQKGEERMLGAVEDIVRRGGQRGIGCTVVTQRSAVLNKNVLTQAQVMVALRTIAPQDLAAMDAWIDVHGTVEQRKTLMESLPSLPRGDAWFWSPGWPTDEGIFKRVHVLSIDTFDSGATPKPGEKRVEPRKRADVDLEALRRQMAATVERAKASDPKRLQRRIAELEAQLAKAQKASPAPAAEKVKRVEIPILKDAQVAALTKVAERLDEMFNRIADVQMKLHEVAGGILEAVDRTRNAQPPPHSVPRASDRALVPPRPAPPPRSRPERSATDGEDLELSEYSRGLLRTLAERYPMQLTAGQLAALSGRSARSSTFAVAIAAIKKAGLVETRGHHVLLTDRGRAAAGAVEPAGTSPAEVQAAWLGVLPDYQRELLRTLLEAGGPLTREELAARANKSATSSTFAVAMSSLKRNGLVDVVGGEVRATDELIGGVT
jgi:hypothetical protein